MSLISKACQGAQEGYNNFFSEMRGLEGSLTGKGGISLGLVVAAVALRFFKGDNYQTVNTIATTGIILGLLKGTKGEGIPFYRDNIASMNAIANLATMVAVHLTVIQPLISQLEPSMIRLEMVALISGFAGAIIGGALKKVVD